MGPTAGQPLGDGYFGVLAPLDDLALMISQQRSGLQLLQVPLLQGEQLQRCIGGLSAEQPHAVGRPLLR